MTERRAVSACDIKWMFRDEMLAVIHCAGAAEMSTREWARADGRLYADENCRRALQRALRKKVNESR